MEQTTRQIKEIETIYNGFDLVTTTDGVFTITTTDDAIFIGTHGDPFPHIEMTRESALAWITGGTK